jgi:Predicted Na+-dependent transporter
MKLLVPSTVLLLMVSVGMSLNWTQFLANWRRLTVAKWGKLLVATFIIPPILALALGSLLPLDRGTLIGLFLIAVAPGAPLMTRSVAKRGFDMELAASYQRLGAFLTPIMIPLLIGAAGWIYGHNIWVSPAKVLAVIATQQFVPLLIGVALMYFAPAFSTKIRSALNVIGNALLMVMLIVLLVKMGPALMEVSPWVVIAVLLLEVGCIAASFAILTGAATVITETLVVCNVNRHVGLALLLSGAYFRNQKHFRPSPLMRL